MTVPIETYGMKKFVSRELATRQRSDTEKWLREQIESKVRKEGYEPLRAQFSCVFVSPEEMAVDPMGYGGEDYVFARDRDYFLALVKVRCYPSPDAP